MKRSSLLDSVEVKNSCTQEWDKMYGNDEVRFCEHCVKNVHDLSAMTQKKAEKLVARSNGSICVRYIRRPDGKIQTVSDKLYQISGRSSRVAAGVFSASLTLASSAYAQGDIAAPRAQDQIVKNDKQTKNTAKSAATNSIHGTILDSNGAVVPGVRVALTGEKIGRQTAVSDDEGRYVLANVPEGNYKLGFESPGFRTHEIDNIHFTGETDAKYDVNLDVEGMVMGVMVSIVNFENQMVLAVHDNDAERIKELISQGANVNEKDNNGGITALHLAVQEGKTDIVELLLNAGARVNMRDESRRTAIMMIAESYDPDEIDEAGAEEGEEGEVIAAPETRQDPAAEIFRLLIAHGAKVNLRDDEGMTALMFAARNGHAGLLRLLIDHRAGIDIQAKNGRTALMEAVNEGQTDSVKILLEAGANVDLKDNEGYNAMSLCSDSEIERLLTTYGAREEEEPVDN